MLFRFVRREMFDVMICTKFNEITKLKRQNNKNMNRVSLFQGFVVLLCLVTIRETTGEYRCFCEDEIINCTSRSFSAFPKNEIANDCSNFKKIDLSSNKFEIFPDSEIKNFQYVNMSRNSLYILHSPTALDTKVLDVSANKITKIEMRATMVYLEELYASRNALEDNVDNFLNGNCNNLRILDVSINKLKYLSGVPSCQHLFLLNASNNDLQSLPQRFRNLTELTYLDLSSNSLDSLMNLPTHIKILNVSHNNLKQIASHPFKSMDVLNELDLSYNYIEELDDDSFSDLTSLKRLDLSNNSLSVVPPLKLRTEVRTVLLNRNKIASFHKDGVLKLLLGGTEHRLVDLRSNPILSLDKGLHEIIQHLDVEGAVSISPDCTCINGTLGNGTLLLCVEDQDPKGHCWVDVARQTTTAMLVTITAEMTDEIKRSNYEHETSTSAATQTNATVSVEAAKIDVAYASHFMTSLGAAKLSFLAFLLITLIILIIINCIVGDPIVDERWWEEKVRGDQVVT